jgi:hypothetical protein
MWIAVPIGGIVAGIVAAPYGYQAFTSTMSAENPPAPSATASQAHASTVAAAQAPKPASEAQAALPRFAGCIDGPRGGYCIDRQGKRVDLPPALVAWNARNLGGFIGYEVAPGRSVPLDASPAARPEPAVAAAAVELSPSFVPKPVHSMDAALTLLGDPIAAASNQDGRVLAEMRGRR